MSTDREFADLAVRSGKYRSGSENVADPPDEIFDDFAHFVDALLSSHEN